MTDVEFCLRHLLLCIFTTIRYATTCVCFIILAFSCTSQIIFITQVHKLSIHNTVTEKQISPKVNGGCRWSIRREQYFRFPSNLESWNAIHTSALVSEAVALVSFKWFMSNSKEASWNFHSPCNNLKNLNWNLLIFSDSLQYADG